MQNKLANFLFQNDHGKDCNLSDYRPEIQKMYHKEAEEILSLLAPVIADAEKWRKVEEIAKGECLQCFHWIQCEEELCIFEAVYNALTGKEPR